MDIFDKDSFKSDIGKRIAKRQFGYDFEDEESEENSIIKESKKNDFRPVVQKDKSNDITVKLEPEKKITRSYNNSRNVTLDSVAEYFQSKNVIDEDDLAKKMVLAVVGETNFVLMGYSGSGKTHITDKLVNLLDDVYTIQQSSDLAIFHDADELNKMKFLYAPEMQKIIKDKKSPLLEALKDITEGKDSYRIVTKKNGKGVDVTRIKHNKTVISTLAYENNFQMDRELQRRMLTLSTKYDSEHLKKIHDHKAKNRYDLDLMAGDERGLEDSLRNHIRASMSLDGFVIDPYSVSLREVLPPTQKSVGYVDHYYALLDGSVKFHHKKRENGRYKDKKVFLTSIEDHFHVASIYMDEFINTLNDLKTEEEMVEEVSVKNINWDAYMRKGIEILENSLDLQSLRIRNNGLIDRWKEKELEYLSVIDDGNAYMG